MNRKKQNIVIRVPKNNVTDIAGNAGTGTASINFTYDITRPVLSAITASGVASLSSISYSGHYSGN